MPATWVRGILKCNGKHFKVAAHSTAEPPGGVLPPAGGRIDSWRGLCREVNQCMPALEESREPIGQ